MSQILLVLLLLLSTSSIMNHLAQNKMLVLCQEKQLHYRDRLDQVVRAWSKEQENQEAKRIEKQSNQNSRMISFLTEVLNARQASHSKEFEVLYHQCTDQSRSWNETHSKLINTLTKKLYICEHNTENIQAETLLTRNQKDLAYTQVVEERDKLLKELTSMKAQKHSVQEELVQVKGELIRLRKELDAVKSGAKFDANFFAEIVPETIQNQKRVGNEFSSSSRIHKPAKLEHPELEESDYDYSDDKKLTSSPSKRKLPPAQQKPTQDTRSYSQKDCATLAFEFNKKRVGTSLLAATATSANRCKRLCLSEPLCRAWTFVSETSECLLKRDYGSSVESICCVSGIRCDS